MNGLYTETFVKCELSPAMKLAKGACIAVPVICIIGGLLLGSTALIFVGALAVALLWLFMARFNVDYEYIFCDGQFDFDKITGGEKRKTVLRIDLDTVDVMAPIDAHELDSYRNQAGFTKKDFTSHCAGTQKYVICASKNNEKLWIEFEPSDKMVDLAKQKSPRKVIASLITRV